MPLPDEQLMAQVRDGDIAGLSAIFDRHHRALFHFFLRLTQSRTASEDLVQDVFYRVLKYRHTYQTGHSVRAWLYQIGRNALMDQAQKYQAEVAMPEDAGDFAAPGQAPDKEAQNAQQADLLRRALKGLAPEKRELLILSRFHGLKYEEIASVMQCEVGTVKQRVYRAVRELGDRFFALSGERAS